MRTSHVRFATSLSILAVAVLGLAGLAGLLTADETTPRGAPAPQKELSQPFLDTLVGSWTTEGTAVHDGRESKGTGKSTYAKGIGDTALIQTYENQGIGPDGKPMNFHGHGIYKVSDDGKFVTVWWFCNMSPDVLRLHGAATDTGIELVGDNPAGGRVSLSFKKTADGLAFSLSEGSNMMNENYSRAK